MSARTYGDVMKEEARKREREQMRRALEKIMKEREEMDAAEKEEEAAAAAAAAQPKRRNRWDETQTPGPDAQPSAGGVTPVATPAGMTWDATPTPKRQRSRSDETPARI